MSVDLPNVEADFISTMTSEQLLSAETCQMIVDKDDGFEREKCLNQCLLRAKEVGVTERNFKNLLKEYKIKLANIRGVAKGNKTKFIDQPIELNCGDWICDIAGVKKNQMNASSGNYETKFASPIPIVATEILKNMDDNTEKVKLAFFKEGWQTLICNRSTTASTTKIIELADKGLEVNSDNSKLLVKYIADLVALNLDILPKYNAISRLGWVGDEFMPYNDNIKFDGEKDNKPIYDSVCERGDYQEWIDYTSNLRKRSALLRMQMAASFASPLLEKINVLPFILHFWGETGTGKTVGLMIAMSIWGNPKKGKMWRTINNTTNYVMQLSAFMHNLPVGLDELQSIKQFNTNYDHFIMQICEGINRGRMSYDKVGKTESWDCAYIFTGEEPITKENSGGGTRNRVIEIECTEPVVESGNEVVEFILKNYGFAGRDFIDCIKGEDLKEQYKKIYDEIMETCDTTEKQAIPMSAMLLGDMLSVKYIYKNETPLTVADVKKYLATKKEVDISERAYEWILNLIAVNYGKFKGSEVAECWGKIDEENIFINKKILIDEMSKAGFEFDAVKAKWAKQGYLIRNSQGKMLHCTYCFGVKASYIKLKQRSEGQTEMSENPPF